MPAVNLRSVLLFPLMVGLSISANLSHASDFEREERLAEEVIDGLFTGDAVYLSIEAREFLAIDTLSETDETKGAAIILHGRGFHPDWPDTTGPLRVGLSERGWRTLSLQMPVLEKEAKYFDYVPVLHEAYPRIEAAIDYLEAEGVEEIILIAHSCGAHMAMAWIEEQGDQRIDAYVGIGSGATDYRQPMQRPFPFDQMNVPILDIYGADDYPAVHRLAPERLEKIKTGGNPRSMQRVVPDADHYFTGQGDALVGEVADWLDAL